MKRTTTIHAALLALACAAHAQFTLQPNEAASKDAKTYGFLPANNFQSNLGIVGLASDPHQFRSLIQFDLALVPYTSSQVASVTLQLFCISIDTANGGGPGEVALREITAAWTETGVTWATFPAFNPAIVDSETVATAGQWDTFDVTNIAKSWLDTPTLNNGLGIFMDTPTGNMVLADADGITGASPDPTKAPILSFHAVPEPGSALLIAAGLSAFAFRRRRA